MKRPKINNRSPNNFSVISLMGFLEMLLKVSICLPFNVPYITPYQCGLIELQLIAVCHSCQKLAEKRCKPLLHSGSQKIMATCIMID